ncbi:unnamed protein product, partial [Closterium sp. NIES-53]
RVWPSLQASDCRSFLPFSQPPSHFPLPSQNSPSPFPPLHPPTTHTTPSSPPDATNPDPRKPWTCDISSGSWTPSTNLPLYTGLTCPYIRSGHNCQSAGRSDMSYQKLRWRPWRCNVTQFTSVPASPQSPPQQDIRCVRRQCL